MPIGSRTAGVATGPRIGPRYVDPNAAAAAGAPQTIRSPAAVTAQLTVDAPSSLVWSGPTVLLGWSVSEEAAGAAKLLVRDGTASGALLGVISLADDESNREWFGPDGIAVYTGLWIERLTGSALGVFYHRP